MQSYKDHIQHDMRVVVMIVDVDTRLKSSSSPDTNVLKLLWRSMSSAGTRPMLPNTWHNTQLVTEAA